MEIRSRSAVGALVLTPGGRIDQDSADRFKQALDPYLAECGADGPALVLDFSGVDYISSVGLRALMLAARQVKAQGGRIVIAALKPMVREVFEISRFNLVFTLFPEVDAAVAAVQR